MTKEALDYETKASYTVDVTATDTSDESATITVTITVTDVNEAPEFALERYDTNDNGRIDKTELVEADL